MPLICFASPKGGVGKTTLAANVADALRRDGRRVLVIDCDPQNSLRLHFGLPLGETAGFLAELPRRGDWRAQLRETPCGVAVLPHGAVDLHGALALANALAQEPELLTAPVSALLADPGLTVVVDTAPGPSQALAALVPLASMVVAVLQAEALSAALIPDVVNGRFLGTGTLAALFASRLRVVLNGVDLDSRLSLAAADAVARHVGPRLLGAVCRDERVAEALAMQQLVLDSAPECRAAGDIRVLARAVAALVPAGQPPAGWAGR